MAQEDNNAAQEQAQQPGFSIEKIYVKDASLEIPHAPQIFTERTQPQVGIELSNFAQQIEENIFEVAIKVTVTSKIEDKTVYLVEVTQAGIFQISGVPEENMELIVGITCPNILFPYAREAVSNLVVRAGFQPVLLNPINFEALFAQQKQQQAETAQA
ncbi:MAG: protein-export chaperone SecB [Methylotenera sp. 24-45-7]|jgi:preprotein translocase subunit SecB|nr:MAG: protein-export chaperone SecB [Methylotenera sp. 24-45-7]OZA09887.1 MAG: protein-export chaperone SecB [Methylotenera sp. 17-45-7]OZA54556.1 MAG: protein-export chaperone SecB [Methylophilales bacterium 39-45-7]HQS37610.1 protein-export chaperone SecB [Methylotenera sp.]HQS43251.1 protein-export chaperone SecB [Methylotenera sp.]